MSASVGFDFEDDVLIKYIPCPEIGPNIYRNVVVIDKETFIKCYNKWIKGEEEDAE